MENVTVGSEGCQIAAAGLLVTLVGVLLFPLAGLAIAFFGASTRLTIGGMIANDCGSVPWSIVIRS